MWKKAREVGQGLKSETVRSFVHGRQEGTDRIQGRLPADKRKSRGKNGSESGSGAGVRRRRERYERTMWISRVSPGWSGSAKKMV